MVMAMNYIEILIKETESLKAMLDTDWHDMTDSPAAMVAMENLLNAHKHIKTAIALVDTAKMQVKPMRQEVDVGVAMVSQPNTSGRFVLVDDRFDANDPHRWWTGSTTTSGGNTTSGFVATTRQPDQPQPTERPTPGTHDQQNYGQMSEPELEREMRRRRLQDGYSDFRVDIPDERAPDEARR
jgi:hypothetical protein